MKRIFAILWMTCLLGSTLAIARDFTDRTPLIVSIAEKKVLVKTVTEGIYFFEVCHAIQPILKAPASLLQYLKIPEIPCSRINSSSFNSSTPQTTGQIAEYFESFLRKNIRERAIWDRGVAGSLLVFLSAIPASLGIVGLRMARSPHFPPTDRRIGLGFIVVSAGTLYYIYRKVYTLWTRPYLQLDHLLQDTSILDQELEKAGRPDLSEIFDIIVQSMDEATTVVFNNINGLLKQ